MTQEDLIDRTEDEQKRAIEMHDSFKNELLKRQLSNTENYDKSILTLSSAALAFSLTFISNINSKGAIENLLLIKTSWLLFLITIVLSLVAYVISNKAISEHLQIAEDYYIHKKQSAFSKKNHYSKINNTINLLVGIIFSLAITFTIIFVISNIKSGDISMTDKKVTSNEALAVNSALLPKMQSVPIIKSAEIPTMQAAPSSTAQQTQSSQKNTSQKD